MEEVKHSGWKHPGRRSSDYSQSEIHDHDRRKYAGAASFRGKGPKNYHRDGLIHEEICEALKWSPEVDATNIEILVRDHCVYLEGSVDSRHAKKLAEELSENVNGVFDVFNFLEVRPTLDLNSDKIIARGDEGLFSTESFKKY